MKHDYNEKNSGNSKTELFENGASALNIFSLSDFLDISNDIVLGVDAQQQVVYLNNTALDFYGVTQAVHVLGYSVNRLYRSEPPLFDNEAKISLDLKEKGYWRGDCQQTKNNGEIVDVECSITQMPLNKSNDLCWIMVMRDITARKKAEALARHNELRFRLALEAAYLISFEWDIQRDSVQRFIALTPQLPNAATQTPRNFAEVCQVVHPDDLDLFKQNVEKALTHEQGVYESEFRMLLSDGNLRWLYERGRVIYDDYGKPAFLIGLSQDITERKLNEVLLLQTQRRCAEIVESALDAIITIDSNQTILQFNAAAEQMFNCTAAEIIGTSLTRFIPERFQLIHSQALANFAQRNIIKRSSGKLNYIIGLRSNGEEFPLEASVSLSEVDGKKAFTAILRDISKRKYTEDKLRESEARLRLFIEHAPVSIAMFDRDMRYLAVSNRWKHDYKLPLDIDITGYCQYDLFPEIPPHWKDVNKLGLAGETIRRDEEAFKRADGSVQWVKWEVMPWFTENNQVGGILIAAEEITERVLARKQLRLSQEDLSRAQAVGQIGSWRMDLTWNIITWSEEMYRIFGLPLNIPVNYSLFLELVHPDDRALVDRVWSNAIQSTYEATEVYDIEYRIIANEQIKWVRAKAYFEFNSQGIAISSLGINQDITERKLAELALKEANQRKDEFLAMLAHELRNPLAPIRNAVLILNRTGAEEHMRQRATAMIERQVQHLVRLVDDLLDVSRVSQGKIKLKKQAVDLTDIIKQAIETSQPLIEARKHQLQVKWSPYTISLEGDPTRLVQVISNLLNNAAKYTDMGGAIKVMVGIQPSTMLAADYEAVVTVIDNGQGIEASALQSLFELFYQVHRNVDRAEGGLGIGLSLVKSLIEMHGGRVQAYSAGRGKGSEFSIYLPCLSKLQPKQLTLMTNVENPIKSGHRILVVDDNPDVAESMAMLLELFGHKVLCAHDGRQAVDAALRERPRVVFLDIGLPYLNGYEACQAMRQAGLVDTFIVALTGYGQEDDKLKAEQAGFNEHMAKPVDVQVLEDLLASLPLRT